MILIRGKCCRYCYIVIYEYLVYKNKFRVGYYNDKIFTENFSIENWKFLSIFTTLWNGISGKDSISYFS